DTELVAMHAGRRAEFADLGRLSRIAHVMHGEALRPVIARAADRADIGMTLVNLNETPAAPRRRRIVAEEPEVLRFFGLAGAHPCAPLIPSPRLRGKIWESNKAKSDH